jgi:hypothetical protein
MNHQIEKPAVGRSAIEIEKTSRARVFRRDASARVHVGLTVRDSSDVCVFCVFFVFSFPGEAVGWLVGWFW